MDEYIIYFDLAFLTVTTAILTRNLVDFTALRSIRYGKQSEKTPLVSILIPARNEEQNIENILSSCLSQDYPFVEIIVLDDQSDDRTAEIVRSFSEEHPKVRLEQGIERPPGWLGKPWACHQLSKKATGDIFVFVDADVWFEPTTVSKIIHELKSSDMITVWPEQKVVGFWEKMVIPMIYHTLFTLLPAKYVERDPRWMPGRLRKIFSEQFAAACGQFLALNRSAYQQIGGHRTVQQQIVEDVELAKAAKRNKLKLKMYHGAAQVYCRMYDSPSEIWNGLRKNFFVGFNKNVFLFLLMAVLHFMVFILPYGLFIYYLANASWVLFSLSSAILFMILLQRWVLDHKFSWNPLISLLHPVSVFWFQLLGIRCLADHLLGIQPKWKGRSVTG